MNLEETLIIGRLRDRGYAICIFSPEELRGADPSSVENVLCMKGWDAIDWYATEEEEQV